MLLMQHLSSIQSPHLTLKIRGLPHLHCQGQL